MLLFVTGCNYMVKVVKFGGSSLADANQFRKVADIIKNDPAPFYPYEQYQIAIGKADGQGNTTGIISAAEYASLRAAYLKGLNF